MNTENMVEDRIFDYISGEINQWIDESIFQKQSFDELGKLYYNHILCSIEDANIDSLNSVVKKLKYKSEKCVIQSDYHMILCRIIGFSKLPKIILEDVNKEYHEVFDIEYGCYKDLYENNRRKINDKLKKLKDKVDKIKVKNKTFLSDISSLEKELYDNRSKCKRLKTNLETNTYFYEYIKDLVEDFCNLEDKESVEYTKMQLALRLSKFTCEDAKSFFKYYKNKIEYASDVISRPYSLFFKVKTYIVIQKANDDYMKTCFTIPGDEALEKFSELLKKIPAIDDMEKLKGSDSEGYIATLNDFIKNNNIIEYVSKMIEDSKCLIHRKSILIKSVNMFDKGEYALFNNIIPIQIEGMFADFLNDTTTFSRFTKFDLHLDAVLRNKISALDNCRSGIYPECVGYFMYYFNNIIRNYIAHGNYVGDDSITISDEIFAKELFLDMGMLVYMISQLSEFERMHRFIKNNFDNTSNINQVLFSVIRNKKICLNSIVEDNNPIHIAYWLINPYYEKRYSKIGNIEELKKIRKRFFSVEFWEYVLDSLDDVIRTGYDYLDINPLLISVVNGLFSCSITSEVKEILKKVNRDLKMINEWNSKQR